MRRFAFGRPGATLGLPFHLRIIGEISRPHAVAAGGTSWLSRHHIFTSPMDIIPLARSRVDLRQIQKLRNAKPVSKGGRKERRAAQEAGLMQICIAGEFQSQGCF